MPKLPVVRGKNLIKALEKMGFYKVRQNGSHVFLSHKDGRCTTIPIHSNRDIPNGTFREILNDLKISKGEIMKIL
jgi:predicted RNA binding protein YcfA (HicA-like mRNA interferase family)